MSPYPAQIQSAFSASLPPHWSQRFPTSAVLHRFRPYKYKQRSSGFFLFTIDAIIATSLNIAVKPSIKTGFYYSDTLIRADALKSVPFDKVICRRTAYTKYLLNFRNRIACFMRSFLSCSIQFRNLFLEHSAPPVRQPFYSGSESRTIPQSCLCKYGYTFLP